MHSVNSPTIDLSELSFPISIDAASTHTAKAIRLFLQRKENDAKTQVFDALTVSEHAHPDYMENPTQGQLGIIVLAFELAALPFPVKGTPMDHSRIEIYLQAFNNYVHESRWFINVMTVEWQMYYDECIRQVQDEHRTRLKEKIADGSIKAISANTFGELGKDGWHPSNLLFEQDFLIFCNYLKITTVHDSNAISGNKDESKRSLEALAALKGAEKDKALYDNFLLDDGKFSGDNIISRGGQVKKYALALNVDVRTIKKMLLRGRKARIHNGAFLNTLMSRKGK